METSDPSLLRRHWRRIREEAQALLKYKNGDVARVAEIMDVEMKMNLGYEYREWVVDNLIDPLLAATEKFFENLLANLGEEQTRAELKWETQEIAYSRQHDGTYAVECYEFDYFTFRADRYRYGSGCSRYLLGVLGNACQEQIFFCLKSRHNEIHP